MHSRSLISLTDFPPNSFAGASATGSITQWALIESLNSVQSQGPLTLRWYQDVTGAQFAHAVSFEPRNSQTEPTNYEPLWLRVLCHVLVNRVPDDGLHEALESLSNIYEFHSTIAHRAASLASLPEATGTRAKLGESFQRPAFLISDDE